MRDFLYKIIYEICSFSSRESSLIFRIYTVICYIFHVHGKLFVLHLFRHKYFDTAEMELSSHFNFFEYVTVSFNIF